MRFILFRVSKMESAFPNLLQSIVARKVIWSVAKIWSSKSYISVWTNKRNKSIEAANSIYLYLMTFARTRTRARTCFSLSWQILKFLACCAVESDYLPLHCLESCFKEATETVKQSNFVDVLERDGVKVVTMHERDHKTLRDLLTGRKLSTCGKKGERGTILGEVC